MKSDQYASNLNTHLSYLFSFARQSNEIDFAASLSGEFRGSQDAGWSTTITGYEVYQEITDLLNQRDPMPKHKMRQILMLYCQLAEAGGVYETLKNLMGVLTSKPYNLWPFQKLVRVKNEPRRVIGPNANKTFRDLATTASDLGFITLSEILEATFRDDIRNGISHADYVIWEDGLRLRNRNGGYANKIEFDELSEAITRGVTFFQFLDAYSQSAKLSFDPPKEIIGRFSANAPTRMTIAFDSNSGAFSISTSSPGPELSAEYKRQSEINKRLGGRALAVFTTATEGTDEALLNQFRAHGFEPNHVSLTTNRFKEFKDEIDNLNLWDSRNAEEAEQEKIFASPWGFCAINSDDIGLEKILPKPILQIEEV